MARLVNEEALKAIIADLENLSEPQKQRIRDRWLNYVLRWDDRADENKKRHYVYRRIVVIGGVVLPALIGTTAIRSLTNLTTEQANVIQWVAFALSLIVGISGALEELFRHGDIWREKRAAAELLNCEGWRYFQLAGKYKGKGKTHVSTYSDFATAVEDIIEHEIKDYLLVTHAKENKPGNGSTEQDEPI